MTQKELIDMATEAWSRGIRGLPIPCADGVHWQTKDNQIIDFHQAWILIRNKSDEEPTHVR